jgi:hypothetical protein
VRARIEAPIVQVTDQATGQAVYTVRIPGRGFTPRVAREGVYSVRIFDDERNYSEVVRDLRSRPANR